MEVSLNDELLISLSSTIVDNLIDTCQNKSIEISPINLVPSVSKTLITLKNMIYKMIELKNPYIVENAKPSINFLEQSHKCFNQEKIESLNTPPCFTRVDDVIESELAHRSIKYVIPMKCKVLTQHLKIPLLRFGDRILLSQPISDISNLYLLCACVTKSGNIIGPYLHKDQDMFRQQLSSHESGLVSYELPVGKSSRNLRDRLSSFGPTIRTRNGLPFDRESPAGTDPVFFWILEKHSERIWGSTQVFVVGCKKSSFFKDNQSPSSEEILKRKLVPLPLDPMEGLPSTVAQNCSGTKPLVLLWDSLIDDTYSTSSIQNKRSTKTTWDTTPKRAKLSDQPEMESYNFPGITDGSESSTYSYTQLASSYTSSPAEHYQLAYCYDSFNQAQDPTQNFTTNPWSNTLEAKEPWFVNPVGIGFPFDDNLLSG